MFIELTHKTGKEKTKVVTINVTEISYFQPLTFMEGNEEKTDGTIVYLHGDVYRLHVQEDYDMVREFLEQESLL